MSFFNELGVALPLPSRSTRELFAMEVTIPHAADTIDYELRDIREWDGIRRSPLHVCEKSARWFANQCFGNPRLHNMIEEPLPQVSRKRKATRSPLAGKLFDETGDRLTPSHSRKNGKRLRYYISRRLVTDRCRKHPDAWRLPAEQLEGLLSDSVVQHLGRSGVAAVMTTGLQASNLPAIEAALRETLTPRKALALIERADLRPGALWVELDAQLLAGALNIVPDNLNSVELSIEAPFQMRRRGVELKLHLGVAPPEVDPVLVRNIVKARNWLAMLINGKTFAEIAETEGTSKRRIQAVVELALLSPDVLGAIATGEQPAGLTSDYLIKTSFSAIWSEQHQQFAEL